jgi:hypothetical protein
MERDFSSRSTILRGTQQFPEDGNKLPKHVEAQGLMCEQNKLIRCFCWVFYKYIYNINARSDYQVNEIKYLILIFL